MLALLLGGCAVLSPSPVAVDGAQADDAAGTATIAISPSHTVLLRAVDGTMLPDIRISNQLRPLAYVLRPGPHVLWLSEAPAGIPLLPQRIGCHVLRATFAAGARYELRFDRRRDLPVLTRAGSTEPEVLAELVDRPLLMERGCRWQ